MPSVVTSPFNGRVTNKRAKYQIYLGISEREYLRRSQSYEKSATPRWVWQTFLEIIRGQ